MRLLATALVALTAFVPAAAQGITWDEATGVWTYDGATLDDPQPLEFGCDAGLFTVQGVPQVPLCEDLVRIEATSGAGDDLFQFAFSFEVGDGYEGASFDLGPGRNTVRANNHPTRLDITAGTGRTDVSASAGEIGVTSVAGSETDYWVTANVDATIAVLIEGTDQADYVGCSPYGPFANQMSVVSGSGVTAGSIIMTPVGTVRAELGEGDDFLDFGNCANENYLLSEVTFALDGGLGKDALSLTGSPEDEAFVVGTGLPQCPGTTLTAVDAAAGELGVCAESVETYFINGGGGDTTVRADPGSTGAGALAETEWVVSPTGAYSVSDLARLGAFGAYDSYVSGATSCDVELPVAGSAKFLIDTTQDLPCDVKVPEGGHVDPELYGGGDLTCELGTDGEGAVWACTATDASDGSPLALGFSFTTREALRDLVGLPPDPPIRMTQLVDRGEAVPVATTLVLHTTGGKPAGISVTIRYSDGELANPTSDDTLIILADLDPSELSQVSADWTYDGAGEEFVTSEMRVMLNYRGTGSVQRLVLADLFFSDAEVWDRVEVRTTDGVDVFSDPPGAGQTLTIASGATANRGGLPDSLVIASGGAPFSDDGSSVTVEGYGPLTYAGFDVVEVRDAFATAAEPVAAAEGLRLTARPNPSAGAVALDLALDAPGPVRVTVLDMLGRTVARVWDGPLGAGAHALTWDAAAVAPGVYAVRVETDRLATARMVTVAR